MSIEDLSNLYQEKPKYIREIDERHPDYWRLVIETLEWKIPNLMIAIPPQFQPDTVAEIGCFCGHLIGNIFVNGRQEFERYGYDINSDAIALGQKLYPQVIFSAKDVFSEGVRFDLIILSDIVEHIEDDQKFLIQCSQISDYVLLNLPLEKSISQRNRKYGYDDPSGHLRAYNLTQAFDLIRSSGLSIKSWHTRCVVKDPVYKKIQLMRDTRKINKITLKRKILSSLDLIPGFPKAYYGSNLFTFLKSKTEE